MATNPLVPSFRYPFESEIAHLAPEVQQAHRSQWNAITDLYQANASLKSQIEDTKSSITSTVTTNTNNTSETVIIASSVIGNINNQTGNTAYTSQQSDYGSFVILSDASPVAVTLNDGVTLPWFCAFINEGAGLVTVTPASGTISFPGSLGAGSMTIPQYFGATVIYDGTNFFAVLYIVPPQNTPAVTHQFLTAYNSITGAFSQAQPAIADVSGLSAALALLAPIASPTFTGTVTQPTPSVLTAATTATSATAGAASALPATPALYLDVSINGTTYKIPAYAV